MYKFNFNSKAEYLEQKKEWHLAFLAQIKKIRVCKEEIKNVQRERAGRGMINNPYHDLAKAREEILELISIRQESRREAYKQMMATTIS